MVTTDRSLSLLQLRFCTSSTAHQSEELAIGIYLKVHWNGWKPLHFFKGLWTRPCEPCNGMSGRNQVYQGKNLIYFPSFVIFPLWVFYQLSILSLFFFFGGVAERAACSCSLLCIWPASASVCLLFYSHLLMLYFLKALEIQIIFPLHISNSCPSWGSTLVLGPQVWGCSTKAKCA